MVHSLLLVALFAQALAGYAQQCTPGVPVPAFCSCGFGMCDVGEICDPNKYHGSCTLPQQCPAGQAAQGDCQCGDSRCRAGDRCDPNANNGEGACAKESQLPQCPQGQLAAAYCLCGTEMCAAGLQCNSGKCDLPSGPISTCPAQPQLAPSSGCLCGSNICTRGEVCVGSPQRCDPACPTTALADTLCHCGGSQICGWNQLCSTQNGSPRCIPNQSSCATDVFADVSQCSNPTFRYYCEASCILAGH
ncbi:hypothetical protein AAVH_08743 [Aphelenchoides avenae]|nr:hypothetical protein AAVH_08743 [Aphelenchus avenae]